MLYTTTSCWYHNINPQLMVQYFCTCNLAVRFLTLKTFKKALRDWARKKNLIIASYIAILSMP
jgi:hypothetical protein